MPRQQQCRLLEGPAFNTYEEIFLIEWDFMCIVGLQAKVMVSSTQQASLCLDKGGLCTRDSSGVSLEFLGCRSHLHFSLCVYSHKDYNDYIMIHMSESFQQDTTMFHDIRMVCISYLWETLQDRSKVMKKLYVSCRNDTLM